ncbi:MAG: hypothetical protein HY741_15895 [Chloroflexi bacterium]|nr:hypothetical protein [Chloroflexota bacterium]
MHEPKPKRKNRWSCFTRLLVLGLLATIFACRPTSTARTTLESPAPLPPPTIVATPTVPVTVSRATAAASPTRSSHEIIVGTEYILIENPARVKRLAAMLAPIRLSAAKPYAEHIEWGEMQKTPGAPIDFSRLDSFVREFQNAGFTEFLVALKPHNPWAAREYGKLFSRNPSPEPEYMDAFEAWIQQVVERYDADGIADLPGLKYPVRMYEIGSEFSSYEPEPVDDYLAMLARAHRAAHRASADVLIAHAAFLTTTVFKAHPAPENYPAAFAAAPARFMEHPLEDMRKILDQPQLFDLINFHSIGDPYEIEANVQWLTYEMQSRGYAKPIIISDTSPTPFLAWGFATACDKPPEWMGLVIPPATEADRCRLAAYFTKLVKQDPATVRWTQSFAAQDMVTRVVIAAEQNILLVNTAFTEDLFWQKLEAFQAGAGTAAWGGLVDLERGERRAGFYALQQLMQHLRGYDSIQRVHLDEQRIRVYELTRAERKSWIAWYESDKLLLPEDSIPTTAIDFSTDFSAVTIEALITQFGQTAPEKQTLRAAKGKLRLTLTPTPIFIERAP